MDESEGDRAAGEQAVFARWRRELLLAAGFARPLAGELAQDRAVDVHALLELVDRGCPPQLAARILAPLDEERRRAVPAPR